MAFNGSCCGPSCPCGLWKNSIGQDSFGPEGAFTAIMGINKTGNSISFPNVTLRFDKVTCTQDESGNLTYTITKTENYTIPAHTLTQNYSGCTCAGVVPTLNTAVAPKLSSSSYSAAPYNVYVSGSEVSLFDYLHNTDSTNTNCQNTIKDMLRYVSGSSWGGDYYFSSQAMNSFSSYGLFTSGNKIGSAITPACYQTLGYSSGENEVPATNGTCWFIEFPIMDYLTDGGGYNYYYYAQQGGTGQLVDSVSADTKFASIPCLWIPTTNFNSSIPAGTYVSYYAEQMYTSFAGQTGHSYWRNYYLPFGTTVPTVRPVGDFVSSFVKISMTIASAITPAISSSGCSSLNQACEGYAQSCWFKYTSLYNTSTNTWGTPTLAETHCYKIGERPETIGQWYFDGIVDDTHYRVSQWVTNSLSCSTDAGCTTIPSAPANLSDDTTYKTCIHKWKASCKLDYSDMQVELVGSFCVPSQIWNYGTKHFLAMQKFEWMNMQFCVGSEKRIQWDGITYDYSGCLDDDDCAEPTAPSAPITGDIPSTLYAYIPGGTMTTCFHWTMPHPPGLPDGECTITWAGQVVQINKGDYGWWGGHANVNVVYADTTECPATAPGDGGSYVAEFGVGLNLDETTSTWHFLMEAPGGLAYSTMSGGFTNPIIEAYKCGSVYGDYPGYVTISKDAF